MNNLSRIVSDIKKEFKINKDGQVFCSIRGAARLLGIDGMSIVRNAAFSSKRLAETLSPHGFKAADFSCDGIPDTALALIATYFAFKANKKSKQAQDLCMAFMAVGIRAWVQEQLGWQEKQTYVPLKAYTQRVADIKTSVIGLPKGYWCVFVEASQLLIDLEKELGFNINERDLLDGSVGKHWSKFRQGKPWAKLTCNYQYIYPDNRICHPKCYQNSELLMFRDWLDEIYEPDLMLKYVELKYGKMLLKS